ncbi:MAG: response regulator [Planctomycetes bacterium]|nr:response regulator [Planctomycetota bacterium]
MVFSVDDTLNDSANKKAAEEILKPGPILKGKRIIVVDDSIMMRKFFGALLGTFEAECLTADNGITALASLREEYESSRRIDIAVVDLKMPAMGGQELIREIRADEKLRDIPVVIHSTANDRQTIVKCASYGIHGYLIKPSVPAKISQTLAEVIVEVERDPEEKQKESNVCGLSASDVRILMNLIKEAAGDPNDPVAIAVMEFIRERQKSK